MSIIKLKKIEIKGFRSIEEISINLDINEPLILIGKNECGKSNILKAIGLLSDDMNFTKEDKKIMSNIDENCIRYYYEIDKKWLKDKINNFLTENDVSNKYSIYKKENNIDYFFRKLHDLRFKIIAGDTLFSTNLINEDDINNGWYIDNVGISGKKYIFKDELIEQEINIDNAIENGDIEILIAEKITNDIHFYFSSDIINFKPQVIKWNYNESSHQLPKFVLKQDFAEDPNICLPLKNMFLIAGYDNDDIMIAMGECQESDFEDNAYKNLFKKVNQQVAKYINKSWKNYKEEYKDVKIELENSDEKIKISIADKQNYFGFEKRSDGFRRFISFLLMQAIIIEKDTNNEVQKIILIDEPEVGLHPSSARNLKEKLFELSNNALIVYSTHSISMMDTNNIENNIIVEKNGENTEIRIGEEDGVTSGEDLFKAIGYSIYEELKLNNLIVEGASDKKIIRDIFEKENSFDNVGICFSSGVKKIDLVVSLLDLGRRKYVILSDADDMGKKYQKEFGNKDLWFTYKDLGFDYVTIEDFFTNDFIKKTINKIDKLKNIPFEIPEFDKINQLKIYLQQNKTDLEIKDNNEIKSNVDKLKNLLLDNYKKQDIQEEKLLNVLNLIISKLTENNKND